MTVFQQTQLDLPPWTHAACFSCEGPIEADVFKSQRRAHRRLCRSCREATWACESCGRDMRTCDPVARKLAQRGSLTWSPYTPKRPCRRCRVESFFSEQSQGGKSDRNQRVWHCHLYCKGCGSAEPFIGAAYEGCTDTCTKRIRRVQARFNRLMGFRNAQYVEPIFIGRLILRDGDRCSMCKTKLVFDVFGHHPDLASVDHIVPVSAAGDHTYANTRLVCKTCNGIKGPREA